jgi:hypothetical protein
MPVSLLRDSISETLSVIDELIRDLPASKFQNAKKAAGQIERCLRDLRQRYPRDQGAILGTAWAVYTACNKMVDAEKNASAQGQGLIQLLN